MCGILGFINFNFMSHEESTCQKMADSIRYRGPNDQGIWHNDFGVTLAHLRLSILDLSPLGHQPMHSKNERYVIVYNGEVYNFQEIRDGLVKKTGIQFAGHSDTEIILASIEHYGLEEAVKQFVGMFAFALWDKQEKTLHLVRDRLGVKPLYYGWINGNFVFASELKPFMVYAQQLGQSLIIDQDALQLYLQFGYVPTPHSIYKDIFKLAQGHILTLHYENKQIEDKAYWSGIEAAEKGLQNLLTVPDAEAIQLFEQKLIDAIQLRMVSDVPLGAFLSGGVDSSTVVAIMQALSNKPVTTFTIGFNEQGFDEAVYAKKVAEHLRTDHHELYVSSQDALNVIPSLPEMYDEPFADSSQIPTYLVSKLARQHVTVSLSGDGGDELLQGYVRYQWANKIWRNIRYLPAGMRVQVARLIQACIGGSSQHDSMLIMLLKRFIPEINTHRLEKLLALFSLSSQDSLYASLVSQCFSPEKLLLHPTNIQHSILYSGELRKKFPDFTQRMMVKDLVTYLPDDIMVKVDRASMAVSLESREPLLDHRLVEFAWQLPSHLKCRNNQSKWILRQVLYKYVPKELIERPKAGFGIPVADWLRGPLREWASDLLSADNLARQNIFNVQAITNMLNMHMSGKANYQSQLWTVLMFQAWHEKYVN